MRIRSFALLAAALLAVPAYASPKLENAPSSSLTALGVADTSNVSMGQSVSAMFSFGRNWLQTYMDIEGTKNVFTFGLGAIYKFTVAGDRHMGFHVGPGFSIGTVPVATGTTGSKSKFAFSLFGLAGGHFTIFDRLILSVDGGPMVSVIDGDANFQLKPMGEHLGLGIHYLF